MNDLKRIVTVLVGLLFLSCTVYGQAVVDDDRNDYKPTTVKVEQNAQKQVTTKKATPVSFADFPKFVDTGNPVQDAKAYKEAKQKWIEENPEKYQSLISTNTTPTKIKREDYLKMSEIERNRVDQHPDKFEIID
ncbi:MAG: hypothetical protein AAF502_07500 [Bacteroidota bacterium]